jgi:hypothetical protein
VCLHERARVGDQVWRCVQGGGHTVQAHAPDVHVDTAVAVHTALVTDRHGGSWHGSAVDVVGDSDVVTPAAMQSPHATALPVAASTHLS